MRASRKAVAVGCSVTTHLLLLWVMMPPVPKPQVEAGALSVSLVDGDSLLSTVSAAPPTSVAPPTKRESDPQKAPPEIEPLPATEPLPPVDVTAEPIEIDVAASTQIAAAIAAAAMAADGDRCAVGEWLQVALQNEPSVDAALAAIPRAARSVANAVMLWNGTWAEPPPNAAAGMARVRALVITGIASAPDACQAQAISGPVLITVGDPANATVLAFGSGQWRWGDLLPEPQQMQ